MVSDCEIDRFLTQTCHLFLQRSMLKLCSPSYSREVWDYKYANVKGIKNSISLFSWKKAFENLSSNEKVDLLASSLNIFRNYNKKAKNLSKNHRPMIFFQIFALFLKGYYSILSLFIFAIIMFLLNINPVSWQVSKLLSRVHEFQSAFDCNPL